MPARFIPDAILQLKDKVVGFLQQQRIEYSSINTYSTPRRLAIVVLGLSNRQADLNEELKGPAKRIAVDQEGNWTKAAIGFANGKGVTVDDLYFKEINGEECVFIRQHIAGSHTVQILPALDAVISSMTFPKNMRWGYEELRFIRPIRWLIALYGDVVVPLSIAGVSSDRITYGHRFLGTAIRIDHPKMYVDKLKEQYVIADTKEREAHIRGQIDELRKSYPEWEIRPSQKLLQELVHLVEYPTVFVGSFDASFLEVPSEVLTTSMRVNQRYIDVEKDGQLLPYFIGVRNGDSRNLQGVIKGNEKVLSARLADAKFFYDEDQKLSIAQYNERLENVVWHEELGSMADKVRRIRELSGEWAEMLQLDNKTVDLIDRAASICKFDLVTNMVYEFPELQGLMGYYYASKLGEDEVVSRAIYEHYYPITTSDQTPASDISALVAIADKMDTVVGSLLIGIMPTGSQDPYGLRRAAHGIVQILIDKQIELTLEQMFRTSLSVYRKQSKIIKSDGEVFDDLLQFFGLRMKHLLQERGIRYDIIDGLLPFVTGNSFDLVQKARAMQTFIEQIDVKKVIEAFVRVGNLAKKATTEEIHEQYLVDHTEKKLFEQLHLIRSLVEKSMANKDFSEAIKQLSTLQPVIDQFFDSVMVMVEDEDTRNARLALLKNLSNLFLSFADFNKLIIS